MIQRIQTLFLILYIGALVSTFFFPVWQKISLNDETNSIEIIVTGYISSVDFNNGDTSVLYDNFIISGLVIISCIVAAFSIFSYKNRLNQIKLGALNSFLTSVLIIYFLYDIFYNEQYININDKISFLISFYLIFLAIFFNFLANRFIRKDELLVRESERIR
ncbi:MAG: hypothetical protein CMB86_05095 [Flammeovirgaceae bacterium]|nr:hypothetical protein [Flammeovirgaceae bacterium]|tara:strand:- start:844 stop:1329 length:486 start_codon:yes stop_codon:yes gene_type:complete